MQILSKAETLELDDWTTILDDIDHFPEFREALIKIRADPILFQKNLAFKRHEGTGKIVKLYPEPYQIDYVNDPSRTKILVKSRQVGFTTEVAIHKYWKGTKNPGYACCFVHEREKNARIYLRKIKEVNDLLPPQLRLTYKHDTGDYKEFKNGANFNIFSSDAVDAIRGFVGDTCFDEFGIASNSEDLLAGGASASLHEGLVIDIGSTPKGMGNAFARIVDEAGWDIRKTVGSPEEYRDVSKEAIKLYKQGYFEAPTKYEMESKMYQWVDIETASIKLKDKKEFEERYKRAKRNNFSMYSLHAVPWFVCERVTWSMIMRMPLSYPKLLQEYFLSFKTDNLSLLDYEEITNCVVPNLKMIGVNQFTGYGERAVYCGVDPSSGELNETAWMFMVEPVLDENNVMIDPWRPIWYETTWDKRHIYTPRLVNQIRVYKPNMVFIDTTGYGKSVIEDLINVHNIPEGIVDDVNLSPKTIYVPLISNAISLIQSQSVMLPNDERLIGQLYALECERTKTGKKHFTGKSASPDGQDDLVWAYALSVAIGSGHRFSDYKMTEIEISDWDEGLKDGKYYG